jgi:hypothetical protein
MSENYQLAQISCSDFNGKHRQFFFQGQHYIYNIYDYDERRPSIWSYDISNCFNYTERKDFSFKLPGLYDVTSCYTLRQFPTCALGQIFKKKENQIIDEILAMILSIFSKYMVIVRGEVKQCIQWISFSNQIIKFYSL